jgi:uncharacterized protein
MDGMTSASRDDPLPSGLLERLNTAAIVHAILEDYALPERGDHGVTHWARVLENGVRLAWATGVGPDIVVLFALFHDARRVHEGRDEAHGARGAELARSMRGTRVDLDDADFVLLDRACRCHADGHTQGDPVLRVCWDADRLDLGRVGIRPRPERLWLPVARELLPWAHMRAIRAFEPSFVSEVWGV